MAKNKEITNTELATMIKDGFVAADKRTDAKIDKLAATVKAGFEAADKRTDAKIDKLAATVKAGFEAADKRTDAKFEAADKRTDAKIEGLATMVANGFYNMGEQIHSMKQDIDLLKQGQERIEMRLNNVIYRTELDAVVQRVEILEKQIKIVPKDA